MAYRSGTYVAFHADKNKIPGGKTDIDYYQILNAWHANKHHDFKMVNSHEKASAVSDSSKKATLYASLMERLRNSKNMLLIVGETTRFDTDWVPLEIERAVDLYQLPIIAVYTMMGTPIRNPSALSGYWPSALASRINTGKVRAIHIPFKQSPIYDAIDQFTHDNLPSTALSYYSDAAYTSWGIS